jgi:hypothetical protein
VGGCAELLIEALRVDRGEYRTSVRTNTDEAHHTSDERSGLGVIEALNAREMTRKSIESQAHMNDAVRDMLCAVLERIMFGFPSS